MGRSECARDLMATAVLPPCDETVGRVPSERGACPKQGATLVATVMGSSLAFVVGSLVNVALPSMQAEFGEDASGAQWIVNAYLLPLGALVLIGGALGDHYGRRRAFLVGLAIFLIACAACALAPSFAWLLAARVLMGFGAALVAPNSLSIIADGFSGKDRDKSIGTWAAAGAIAGALAPVAGGWIVDNASWRWAFGAVVPLVALTIAVGWYAVRESKAKGSEKSPLDWSGAALVTLSLGFGIWTLIAWPERGFELATVSAAGIAFFTTIAFVTIERRKSERAMTPPDLFANREFVGLTLLTLLLYAALGGLLVLLPYVLIEAFDYGATEAGAALLPFPLVMGLLSRWLGGDVAAKVGTRRMLAAGSLTVAAGLVWLSFLTAEGADYWRDILPGLILMAVGMAASVAPLTSAVLAAGGDARAGVASGVNNATSRIAGLIATALLGPVLASGDAIVAAFGSAALVGAGAALGAVAAALLLVRGKDQVTRQRTTLS